MNIVLSLHESLHIGTITSSSAAVQAKGCFKIGTPSFLSVSMMLFLYSLEFMSS